jgi:hypothetical protein
VQQGISFHDLSKFTGFELKGSMPSVLVKVTPHRFQGFVIMAKLLFRMRHVPDDEAQEVRALLEQNNIDFFETFPGNWGISMPALWLKDEDQYAEARDLLDTYQDDRRQRVQSEYQASKQRGEAKTTLQAFKESPIRFISYFTLIAIVLYLSLRFFLSF